MGQIIIADALDGLKQLPAECVDMCVTSPPYYGLRDYGASGQIGNESTPEEYIDRLVAVFREVRRVLKPNGTLWVNIADSILDACLRKDKSARVACEVMATKGKIIVAGEYGARYIKP